MMITLNVCIVERKDHCVVINTVVKGAVWVDNNYSVRLIIPKPKGVVRLTLLFALIHLLYCSGLHIFEVLDHRHTIFLLGQYKIHVGRSDLCSTKEQIHH